MKKLLVIVFALGVCVEASAQPAPRHDLVTQMYQIAGSDLGLSFQDNADEALAGKPTNANVKGLTPAEAIERMVEPYGFTAVIDNGIAHIRKPISAEAAAVTNQTDAFANQVRARIAQTGQSWHDAAADLQYPVQIGYPTYEPWTGGRVYLTAYGRYAGNYGYDGYYGGYGYGYDPYLYPGYYFDRCLAGFPQESRPTECTRAEVKFDTRGKGMDAVEVIINGNDLGEIGKYSHRLTSGLHLEPDTEYTMELAWTTKSGTKTIIRKIKPSSMRKQDGAYWYPVTRELFDNAPYGRNVTRVRENVSGKDLFEGK